MREGYASVVRDGRFTVWGVLWELALADVPALDRYEGVAGGLYVKAPQPIATAGRGQAGHDLSRTHDGLRRPAARLSRSGSGSG